MINNDVKRELLEQKIALWKNTQYDAQVDARVADALEDEQLKKQSTERIKSSIKAIDVLEELLDGLEEKDDSNDNEA